MNILAQPGVDNTFTLKAFNKLDGCIDGVQNGEISFDEFIKGQVTDVIDGNLLQADKEEAIRRGAEAYNIINRGSASSPISKEFYGYFWNFVKVGDAYDAFMSCKEKNGGNGDSCMADYKKPRESFNADKDLAYTFAHLESYVHHYAPRRI